MTNSFNESSLLPYMTEIRRRIHEFPGAGFDNADTMSYIKEKLSEMSIQAHSVGQCGLSALIGDMSKPCLLLRADTDGLETYEETELPFASKNGRMHLCGHDLHTAQLLGAAKYIKAHEKELDFCVKLMFQSAEENLCGAADMIENGILENPRPIMALMLHVMTATELETGTVIVPCGGYAAPSADFFRIDVSGHGCHGSSPAEGKDPLYAACNIVTALSHINSRELAMKENAVITIGSFNSGDAANVIPDTATLKGTLRCFGKELRKRIKHRVAEISEKTAEVNEVSAKVTFTSGCPSLVNNERLCRLIYTGLCRSLGNEYVKSASEFASTKTSGSEDFAYISEKIPSVMLALCAGKRSDGHIYPLHHPKVTFDEKAMISGCAAILSVVFDCFKAEDFAKKTDS